MKCVLLFLAMGLVLSGTAAAVPPERIISLAPNMTEILYAMGLEERIVGVTRYCDHPPRAAAKPRVGGMSNPSLEAVVSLHPDLVVLTTDGNPRAFEKRLRDLHIATYVFRSRRIRELPTAIRDLGGALEVPEEADRLADRIEALLEDLRDRSPGDGPREKALFIIWPEPLVVAGPGTEIDDALELLEWDNVAGDSGTPYPKFSIEEILHRAPDVIFIGKMSDNMEALSGRLLKRLRSLEAVRKGRVYFTSDALYRLGPRVVEGIRELSEYRYED